MTIITATHCEDPDGRIAEGLILRRTGLDHFDSENHIPVRYDRIIEAFTQLGRRIKDVEDPQVYIADIGFNGQLAKWFSYTANDLTNFFSPAAVMWLDHHQGTQRCQQQLERAGVMVHYNSRNSAGPLVLKHLPGENDSYEKWQLKELDAVAERNRKRFEEKDQKLLQIYGVTNHAFLQEQEFNSI